MDVSALLRDAQSFVVEGRALMQKMRESKTASAR